jgi:hypothetical protein
MTVYQVIKMCLQFWSFSSSLNATISNIQTISNVEEVNCDKGCPVGIIKAVTVSAEVSRQL